MGGGLKRRGQQQERKKQEEQDQEQSKEEAVFTQEEESVQDDTEVNINLDWHAAINIHHQRITGTGKQGLPLGRRGAAVYARDKVVLLGCLRLDPPSFVR